MPYVEMVAATNFSFLHGASHPGELVLQAAALGLGGIGIADQNSFAGVVRGHLAARDVWSVDPSFRCLVGVRLTFIDGTPDMVTYPSDRAAYGRLCQLLTTGNRRAPKGECHIRFDDLAAFADGQLFIFMSPMGGPPTRTSSPGSPLWHPAECGSSPHANLKGWTAPT